MNSHRLTVDELTLVKVTKLFKIKLKDGHSIQLTTIRSRVIANYVILTSFMT